MTASKDSAEHIGLSLVGLVLACVLPLVLFGGSAAWTVVHQKKTSTEQELTNTARALQVAVDRELLGQLKLMQLLATDSSLDHGDLAAFLQRSQRALQVQGGWRNVSLVDSRTQNIVASALPMPTPNPKTSWPAEVEEVIKARQPMIVGVLSAGKIVKTPTIHFLVPVTRGSDIRFVMVATLDPQPLSDVFTAQQLPATWTGAVLDKNMVIAGRSRAAQQFVGKRATPTLASQIAAREAGMFMALNQEGDKVYTVFSRSLVTGWSVPIGIPAAEVEGPVRQLLLQWAAAGSILILFALTLTGWIGLRIVRTRKAYIAVINARTQALRISEARLKTMFKEAPLGIAVVDSFTGHIHEVNSMFTRIVGRTMEEMSHIDWMSITHPDDLQKDLDNMALLNAEKIPGFQMEKRYIRKDGTTVWINMTVAPIYAEDKRHPRHLCMIEDITERKMAEDGVRQMAYFDPLTKLANRLLLGDRLGQAMLAGKRSGHYGALLFIDLDNFKPVNDLHGHEVGDLLLIEVARRIKSLVRQIDTVARFGGDEYVVLLVDLAPDREKAQSQAGQLADKICNVLAAPYVLELPPDETTQLQSIEHCCTASIGVMLFMGSQNSEGEVIRWADMAMYRAKEAGGNSVRFHATRPTAAPSLTSSPESD